MNQKLGGDLGLLGESEDTLSTLTGENRRVTSLVEEWIREQLLGDGIYSGGMGFHSKYGGGNCWAYWLRRSDDELGTDPVDVIAAEDIHHDDPDLAYVLSLYGAAGR